MTLGGVARPANVVVGSVPKAGRPTEVASGSELNAGRPANVAAGSVPYAGRLCRVDGGIAVRPRTGSSPPGCWVCSGSAGGSPGGGVGRTAGTAIMPAGGSDAAGGSDPGRTAGWVPVSPALVKLWLPVGALRAPWPPVGAPRALTAA
jgi:hypothetical protein